MSSSISKRVIKEAEYIIKTKQTIRQLAKVFGVSKSTVHKDLHDRLPEIDNNMHLKVDQILKYHIDIRHIRGGQSTKKKYEKLSL